MLCKTFLDIKLMNIFRAIVFIIDKIQSTLVKSCYIIITIIQVRFLHIIYGTVLIIKINERPN